MEVPKTWQSIRENDIKFSYEQTVRLYDADPKGKGFRYSYKQYRNYVTQADLGPPYVDAPSEPSSDDDIKEDIFIWFD